MKSIWVVPHTDVTQNILLRQADIAMYDAKEGGGNTFRYISQELSTTAFDKASMESAIREGLNNQEFELYYQPIVKCDNMSFSSLEALIRWNHPQLGLIMPSKFIPLAEESDLIIEITKFVIVDAMKTIRDSHSDQNFECHISINYSLKDLESDLLFFFFKKHLQQLKLKGSSICLEITERQCIQSSKLNDKYLNRYRQLGVSFSMDDFGSGYSNLGYLLDKPFRTLKIDRSFISKIGDAKKSEEVVKATINIAKALNLVTVAEGIESQEQLDFVCRHGCDFVQGFYLQVPAPIKKIEHLFKDGPVFFSPKQ